MDEQVSFFDRHEPALAVGIYELTVEQSIKSPPDAHRDEKKPPDPSGRDDTARIVDERPSATTRFAVSGSRFAIAASEIAGQFPPPGSDGDYASTLPHVALSRLTLPWERSADAQAATPWLAVLVFDEAETVVVADAQVGDLQREQFAPDPKQPGQLRDNTLAAGVLSYADGDPKWSPEPGQSLADRCRVIDVPKDLFAKVAPAAADLPWLAHSRKQTVAGGESSLSYVSANRTPPAGVGATAHLVSLEHLAAFLPAADGTPAEALADATAVRLVALASWSFRSLKQTFADRMRAVPCGVFALADPATKGTDGGDTVERALRLGYCALSHRTRAGDATISWYRGPFVPCVPTEGVVPAPDPDAADPAEPIGTADALLRYDPQTAMFDISYAAAWQLGRLLAMADGHFSSNLRAWKSTVAERTALALEREIIGERLGAVLPLDSEAGDEPAAALKAAAASLPARIQAALRSGATSQDTPPPPAAGPGLHKRLTQAQGDVTLPAPLHDWLAGLARLEGVPLRYLVPDERMLPSPSLRFFRLDPNWTRALLEGAFSIARSCTAQAAHDAAVAVAVHAAATPPVSGLLLRGQIVNDWPDLRVSASDGDGGGVGSIVRRIAPGIMLALFDGLPVEVDIHEPPHALHFDLSDPVPRRLTAGANGAIGTRPKGAKPIEIPYRADRVVDMVELASRFAAANSAELALQLAADGEGVSYGIGTA